MSDDIRCTDGNALAGLLGELLAVEPTAIVRACATCGDRRAIGEHRAYAGLAHVLRCPTCDDVAMRVDDRGAELVVEWRGTFTVRRPAQT